MYPCDLYLAAVQKLALAGIALRELLHFSFLLRIDTAMVRAWVWPREDPVSHRGTRTHAHGDAMSPAMEGFVDLPQSHNR